ncbi:MAG: isoprenylcysteine carboxylmethyltransferase family protein [Candidatus Lokiarchaeota archaeon]|nr:isoprenylcysteine carboxylmethyltransferase family protein [Candidatus Lokiarchaeota archaeon]
MKDSIKEKSKPQNQKKMHAHRPDLTGEHKISDIGQIIGLVSFLTVWILDSFIFHFSDFLSRYVPWWVLILIATPIWFTGGILAYKGMTAVFGGGPKEPVIISKGVFKISRHPIYLASLLVYIGWIISTLSLASIIILLLLILFYNYIANYEEKILIEKFGDLYRDYQQQVPKWGIRILNRTQTKKRNRVD